MVGTFSLGRGRHVFLSRSLNCCQYSARFCFCAIRISVLAGRPTTRAPSLVVYVLSGMAARHFAAPRARPMPPPNPPSTAPIPADVPTDAQSMDTASPFARSVIVCVARSPAAPATAPMSAALPSATQSGAVAAVAVPAVATVTTTVTSTATPMEMAFSFHHWPLKNAASPPVSAWLTGSELA